MNKDFEAFKEDISWFIKKYDNVEFLQSENGIQLSKNFINTYPILTKLIRQARILNLKINNQSYKLFSWTNKNGLSCGWLNKIEENPTTLDLIDDHKLLLTEIGGIEESYNQPERSFSNNNNFMFIESECSKGIGGWEEYYEDLCDEENKIQIEYKDFICFVQEANGNVTLYNPKNSQVLLFAHDHSFDNVNFLENQPEYTFHKIHNITNFVDYVEALSTDWINGIK